MVLIYITRRLMALHIQTGRLPTGYMEIVGRFNFTATLAMPPVLSSQLLRFLVFMSALVAIHWIVGKSVWTPRRGPYTSWVAKGVRRKA
mmetsp:Transcript_55045/g.87209  ORF Transcript_55045/g.87209 Transcript_55045/m.87209 type:complete len:89 (+) Transcript_55045:406-672(+)